MIGCEKTAAMSLSPPPEPVRPSVEILAGGGQFFVRRILCVGRNYAAHAREMGGDDRDPSPFFFSKPAGRRGRVQRSDIPYPQATSDLHHEVELVTALGAGGVDVPVERALELVFGYAVGVDLTRRDLQALARGKGQPWDAAKGFGQLRPDRRDSSRPTGSQPLGAIQSYRGRRGPPGRPGRRHDLERRRDHFPGLASLAA